MFDSVGTRLTNNSVRSSTARSQMPCTKHRWSKALAVAFLVVASAAVLSDHTTMLRLEISWAKLLTPAKQTGPHVLTRKATVPQT